MIARVRGKVTYYYYDQRPNKPGELPLGKVYADAVLKWAEYEVDHSTPAEIISFRHAWTRYQAEVLPKKAPRTQVDNLNEGAKLIEFFDNPPAPLAKIRPLHVSQYIDWRTKHGTEALTRANREIALLSHIWNKCRGWGYTDLPNPCRGVERNPESGRDVYVEDDVFKVVWDAADEPLRDALDLAYLCGQRVADTRTMDEADIRDKFLHVTQGKTGAKRRIEVKGKLAALIRRIKARKKKIKATSTRLIVNEVGEPMLRDALRYRFDRAREAAKVPKEAFQFRDLRAKAGTDKADLSGDMRQAQRQLGHASITTTETYVRNRRGDKVTATR